MAKHLASLRPALKPGAKLAYVVGDQASYLRVMIRTGELLAGVANSLGYTVTGIDLFRTRLSTVTGETAQGGSRLPSNGPAVDNRRGARHFHDLSLFHNRTPITGPISLYS